MWGFTRNEQRVLLFLTGAFLAGWGVEAVQERFAPRPAVPAGQALDAGALVPQPEALPAVRYAALPAAGAKPVSLNRATAAELDRVPGVGPTTAARILAARAARGRFRSLEELLDVDGIGPKTLEKMRPHLRID
jgi:competence protein ComEA